MNNFTSISNCLWHISCVPARMALLRALQNVPAVQQQLLLRTVRKNTETLFGRQHCFNRITSVQAFRDEVPVSCYEDYRPYIDAIRNGDARILTSDPVRKLHLSSGTSSASKLLPFTDGLQRDFEKGLSLWLGDLFAHVPGIKYGSAYWVFTPMQPVPHTYESSVPVGFDQDEEYFGPVRKHFFRRSLAVPPAVHHIEAIEDLYYVTLLFLLAEKKLTWISIWNPSFLTLLLERFASNSDRLLADLERGGIHHDVHLQDDVRRFLESVLRCAPARAKEIGDLLHRNKGRQGSVAWTGIWPRLKLISCWADGWAQRSAQIIRQQFPGVMVQAKGLLATEATITIPFHISGSEPCAPILAITVHFFEFMDAADGKIYLAHQLEKDHVYEVIVTTSGGLYRYRLYDLVRVAGYCGRAPCLQFMGKTETVSDHFGEKLHEAHVRTVLEKCFTRHGFTPRFYFIAPETAGPVPCYVLFLEGIADTSAVEKLLEETDQRLCENIHYAYCRRLGQLAPVTGYLLNPGAQERYLEKKMERHRLGTLKVPCLERTPGWSRLLPGQPVRMHTR